MLCFPQAGRSPDVRSSRSVRRAAWLVALSFLLPSSCGKSSRPPVLAQAEQMASIGDFAAADRLIEKNRFQPAVAAHLPETQQRIERYREFYASVDSELRDVIARKGENKALLHARQRAGAAEAEGRSFEAEVWRKRMSSIPEIAKGVERVTAPLEDGTVPQDATDEAIGTAWAGVEEEIDDLVKAGEFRRAVERVREVMPTAGDAAGRFRDKLWQVQSAGKAEIAKILEASEAIEKDKGAEVALSYLAAETRRFPEFGALGGVEQARRRLLKSMGRAAEITWGPGQGVGIRETILQPGEEVTRHSKKEPNPLLGGPASSPSQPAIATSPDSDTGSRYRARQALDKTAQEAFDARDYTRAREDWETAVKFSTGLAAERTFLRRASEARILEDCVAALASAIQAKPDRFRRVDLGNGTMAKLHGIEGVRMLATIAGQTEHVALAAIPDVAFADLISKHAKSPVHRLGAAALYARAFDRDKAEKILVEVFKADARSKPQVDRLLAVIRKEDPGQGGYVLEGKRFVSSRAIARRELLKKYQPRLAELWRVTGEERFLAHAKKLVDKGPEVAEVVAHALTEKLRALGAELDRSKLGRQLEKLFVDREALEDRREHALELIFDTEKYFYPYKPPAVSGDKAGEYAKVQMEVTRRRVLVEQVWTDRKRKVRAGGKLAKSLALYRYVSRALVAHAGYAMPSEDRWLWALPSSGGADIQTIARNERERVFLDKCYAVLATNRSAYDKMREDGSATPAEIDLMQRTNAYRLQMGRLPLRAVATIVLAAREHCEEMARLGYFGHTSPTPGRRTPHDRMRLAGYERGTGENLAINASPAGAIAAWQRSSGHHRNMLVASHRDLGGGVHGRHYNQNFGAGEPVKR